MSKLLTSLTVPHFRETEWRCFKCGGIGIFLRKTCPKCLGNGHRPEEK